MIMRGFLSKVFLGVLVIVTSDVVTAATFALIIAGDFSRAGSLPVLEGAAVSIHDIDALRCVALHLDSIQIEGVVMDIVTVVDALGIAVGAEGVIGVTSSASAEVVRALLKADIPVLLDFEVGKLS